MLVNGGVGLLGYVAAPDWLLRRFTSRAPIGGKGPKATVVDMGGKSSFAGAAILRATRRKRPFYRDDRGGEPFRSDPNERRLLRSDTNVPKQSKFSPKILTEVTL